MDWCHICSELPTQGTKNIDCCCSTPQDSKYRNCKKLRSFFFYLCRHCGTWCIRRVSDTTSQYSHFCPSVSEVTIHYELLAWPPHLPSYLLPDKCSHLPTTPMAVAMTLPVSSPQNEVKPKSFVKIMNVFKLNDVVPSKSGDSAAFGSKARSVAHNKSQMVK